MSWNRSNSTERRDGRRVRRRVPSVLLVALASLALACGAVLWWAAGRGEKVRGAARSRGGRIADRAPQRPSRAGGGAPSSPVGANSGERRLGPTNKVVLTANVKPPTVLGCNYYECVSGGRPLFERPIFTNSAENIIGGLLSARPGERFVPVDLGDDFDADFAASLGAPILAGPDDPPDVAIVKAAVSKAKGKIAAAMANGQRPSEVVTAMRDEMNRVADYRDLLQEDFDKVKETGTAHQIEAYLKEANQLLDEFGAEHLDLPDDEVEEINKRLSAEPGNGGKEKDNEQ